jgi:hypothetical protein
MNNDAIKLAYDLYIETPTKYGDDWDFIFNFNYFSLLLNEKGSYYNYYKDAVKQLRKEKIQKLLCIQNQ